MGVYAEIFKKQSPSEARPFDRGKRETALAQLSPELQDEFRAKWAEHSALIDQVLSHPILFPLEKYRDGTIEALVKLYEPLVKDVLQDFQNEERVNSDFRLRSGDGGDYITDEAAIQRRLRDQTVNYIFNHISELKPGLRQRPVESMFYNKLLIFTALDYAASKNSKQSFENEFKNRLLDTVAKANEKDLATLYTIGGDAYFKKTLLTLFKENPSAIVLGIQAINSIDSNVKKFGSTQENTKTILNILRLEIEDAIEMQSDNNQKSILENFNRHDPIKPKISDFNKKYSSLNDQARPQFVINLLTVGRSSLGAILQNQSLVDLQKIQSALFQRGSFYNGFQDYQLLQGLVEEKINQLTLLEKEAPTFNQQNTFKSLLVLSNKLAEGAEKYTAKYNQTDQKGERKKRFGEKLLRAHVPEHQEQAIALQAIAKEMKSISDHLPMKSHEVINSLQNLIQVLDTLSEKKGNLKKWIDYDKMDQRIKDILFEVRPDLAMQHGFEKLDRAALKSMMQQLQTPAATDSKLEGEKELGRELKGEKEPEREKRVEKEETVKEHSRSWTFTRPGGKGG